MPRTVVPRRSADALTNKLVKAQQKYAATRNAVVSAATQRQAAITEIQQDLAEEHAQLQEVVRAAQ